MRVREEKKCDRPKRGIREIDVKERVSVPSAPSPASPKQKTLAANTEQEKDSTYVKHDEVILYADK